MSLILYFSPLSAPSRSVRTLLLLSKAPFQEKTVDLMKGEHKAPEFQRINPNESLPAIVDGNVKLFESHAILKYIAIRRTMDQYYPKNVQNRARVDCYLDWSSTGMEPVRSYVTQCFLLPMLRNMPTPSNQQELHQDAVDTLQFFENAFLTGSFIFNQPSMTLADVKAIADLSTLLMTGFDFNHHPKIRDYMQRMLSLPEFQTAYKEYFQFLGDKVNDSIKFIINGVDPRQSWKVNLFFHPWSSPSRFARTVLMMAGEEFNEKVIDLQKGEQHAPEFTKINPNETVPAIKHGDLCLFESAAIARYVAKKHNLCNLYPGDAQGQAKVDLYLDFHLTEMKSIASYIFQCFVGPMLMKTQVPANKDELYKDVSGTLEFFMKTFLMDGKCNYIMGSEQPTLADIRVCCDLSQLFLTDFKFDSIRGLTEYIQRVFQLPELRTSHAEFFQFLKNQKIGPLAQSIVCPTPSKSDKLILYFNFVSPPAKAVKSLLMQAGIPFDEKVIDIQSQENTKPAYTAINPNQSIPALSYGKFNLFESHAIMKFICLQYNLTQFYPTYPLRAKIDQYLDYHHTGMRFMSSYVVDFFFGPKFMSRRMPPNKEERLQEVNEGLQFFVEVFLGNGKYKYIMGANHMSIADLSFIGEVTTLFFVDFDFSPYPVLKEYIRNMLNYRLVRETYSKFFMMARFAGQSMNPYIESIAKGTQEGQSGCCQLI